MHAITKEPKVQRRICHAAYDPAAPWRALNWLEDGTPVRWDSSKPIVWVLNCNGLDQSIVPLVEEAMTVLAEVSGLVLEKGEPTAVDLAKWPGVEQDENQPQIVVSGVNPDDLPIQRRRVAGTGGAYSRIDPEQGFPVYVAGDIRLVAERTTLGVAVHEGAHALGLAHVGDFRQQMYRRSRCTSVLGDGDVAGLKAIGQPLPSVRAG